MDKVENPQILAEELKPERVRGRRRHRSRRFRKLRRLARRIRWRLLLVIGITTLVVIGGVAAVLIADAVNQVDQSQVSLNRVLNSLNNKSADEWTYSDFERLRNQVQELSASLDRAESRMFFLQPARSFNSDLDANFLLLDSAQELTLAVNHMLTGLQLTIVYLTEGQEDTTVAQVSSGERTIDLLEKGHGRFVNADIHLDLAQDLLADFDLATLSPDMLLQVEDLHEYYDQAREFNDILIQSPDLLATILGSGETRTYLLLAQNSDEIRPSGGYISTWGWMRVTNSRIDEYAYFPTSVDNPRPPDERHVNSFTIPDWWLHFRQPIYAAWDGSWHADFPSTAQLAAWYYDLGNNPHTPVDGVIAIDLVGFEYILEALGSVYVEEYDEEITIDNFRDVIYRIRTESNSPEHKAFVAAIYRQMLEDWQNVDPSRKADVLGAQLRGLREKHILLYFADSDINAALDTLGWSGALEPALEHDYLMVVDANVTPNKSSRSVVRRTSYDVQISLDGRLNSRLSVNYDYSSALAAEDPAVAPGNGLIDLYINLMQVFVPKDITLMSPEESTQESVEVVSMDEHTMLTSTVLTELNGASRIEYEYQSPVLVESFGSYRRYRLLIQKQAGFQSEQIDLLVTLPPGASLVATDPEPEDQFPLEGLILSYTLDLTRDQWIEVIYQQ